MRYVRIDTEGDLAFNAKLRPLSRVEDQALKEFLREGTAKRWIEKTSAACTSDILFVPKKNGKLRPCINYKPLNRHARKRVYAPPPQASYQQRILQATYYSRLDIKDAYYHLQILPEHRWKTAFRCKYGTYRYNVMPFGLASAPFEFQKYIETVLQQQLGVNVIIHIDDVLIFTDTMEEHIVALRQVESALKTAHLEINEEKSERKKTEILFCGYRYARHSVTSEVSDSTVASWKQPRTKRELQEFMGFCNWHRDGIRGFAHLAGPLYELLAKGVAYEWTAKRESAFQALKAGLLASTERHMWNPGMAVKIYCDASLYGIGAIMTQNNKTVGICSRSLSPAEKNYDTRQRELLAVVYAVTKWYDLLEGHQSITICTDHKNLASDLKPSSTNRRINRWIILLGQLELTWQWIPGKDNPADAPSRLVSYKRGGRRHRSEGS